MRRRLIPAACLAILPIPALILGLIAPLPSAGAATPGTASSSAITGTYAVAVPGPDAPAVKQHRLFFANAQRESLTGAADARRRMRTMVRALRHSRSDLGVLVEIQGSQPGAFRRATSGRWGLIAPGRGVRNGVIYDRDQWRPIRNERVRTFWTRSTRTVTPVVVLASRSGEQVGVIAVHNPRRNARLSRINNRRILAAVRTLQRDGLGVLIAGDFNSRRATLCRFTRSATRLASASHHRRRSCRAGRPAPIDQAFATREITLHAYQRRFSRATDHRFVYSVGFSLGTRPAPI